MCGKENPPDREVCLFCQARLVPLVGKPFPDEEHSEVPEEFLSQEESGQPDSGLPEWLLDLRPQIDDHQDDLRLDGQPGEDASESGSRDDESGWLSTLRTDSDFEENANDIDGFVKSDETSSAEWLADNGPRSDDEQFPEWLESLRSSEETKSESQTDQEEDQDWLRRVRLRREADEKQAYQSAFEESQDLSEATPDTYQDESEKRADESEAPTEEYDKIHFESEESSDEQVDRPSSADLTQEEQTPITPVERDEGITSPDSATFDAGELEGEPIASDAEWLSDIKEETPSEEEELFASWPEASADSQEEQGYTESLPDWLAAGEEMEVPEEPAAKSEDLPEWLMEETTSVTAPPPDAGEQAEEITDEEPSGDIPGWLLGLESTTGATPSEVDEGPMQDQSPSAPVETEQRSTDQEEVEELLEQEIPVEEPLSEQPTETNLTPADLPDWLEAMRPVEAMIPKLDDDAGLLEVAGPLAGLSGVLAAKSDVARGQETPAYSAKLKLTKEHRTHIDILKELVESEGKPQPIPTPSIVSSQNILRWVIALILILIILWTALFVKPQEPLPRYTPETGEVNDLINALPPDARIMVAFDYQPGLSAELDTAAAAVIDHIMLRGAYLTLVSTSPTGPLIAERFFSQMQSSHNYTAGEQYINMGFIPGGAAGLLSLAVNPQGTIPFSTDGVEAWETHGHDALPPLRGIEKITDFSMVLVIVDDPDISRAWIEQVQPFLSSEGIQTPLTMVISAQSEPLVRPYYQASPQQVQGYVAGIYGGASYARLTGRIGKLGNYWNAFSTGLTVAALLIAIGSVINVINVLMSRRGEQSGSEAQS